MRLFKHELKRNRISFIIWTGAIVFLIATCLFLFPEMKGQMDGISDMFASMGGFSQAFGMDKLNFGTVTGFYATECGNILGLGGAFFSALLAVSALAKEEREHTAEFLLTHPVSRAYVVTQKLMAIAAQVLVLNILSYGTALICIAVIGEPIPFADITLLHVAYLLMQLEIASLCFCLSSLIRRGNLGVGLGVSATAYFLNIIANLSDSAAFLKFVTPFGYTDGAEIISRGGLDAPLVAVGMTVAGAAIAVSYAVYLKKDIH